MSSPILAAILGALLGGLSKVVADFFVRMRERDAMLVAISAEVDALCRLMRYQNYLPDVLSLIDDLEKGSIKTANYIVDIRSDYFTVFNALSCNLGHLKSDHAYYIVKFYAFCKTIIDSTRPDGVAAHARDRSEAIADFRAQAALLQATLVLGDRIIQFPKRPPISDLILS